MMALNYTLKSTTFRGRRYVDGIAFMKHLCRRQCSTRSQRSNLAFVESAKFLNMPLGRNSALGEMPLLWHIQLAVCDVLEAKRNGIVAVRRLGLDLRHIAWAGLNDGHRDILSLIVKNARHAN